MAERAPIAIAGRRRCALRVPPSAATSSGAVRPGTHVRLCRHIPSLDAAVGGSGVTMTVGRNQRDGQ
jgi:hypothetical protein